MHHLTLRELQQGLASKQFSSLELTQHFLQRIQQFDKQLNSFITVTEEHAIAQAKHADKLLQQGNHNPLTGIPIAHKDNFCTTDIRTSCASKMLDNFISPYNAQVVEQLNQAGMVTLGKTNMDEFAMGSSNETSFYGACKNPWDTSRVPGGSSGGSAAAVAALLTPAATGTDTSGSIRQPAAFCNLTGFKPSYGLVSRHGMVALASSLDQAGTLTRTAEDAALLLNNMAGFDGRDSNSMQNPCNDYAAGLNQAIQGLKIGLPRALFNAADSKVLEQVEQAIKQLEKMGAAVVEIELPHQPYALACYKVIGSAEASSNLSRYDGIRYGYRCSNPEDLQDLYLRTRAEGFGEEVKQRILLGTYVLTAEVYQTYYHKALQVRRLIKQDYNQAFSQVDVILTPTVANTAFALGSKNQGTQMAEQDSFTVAANLAGLPAISIPCGLAEQLPVGLQLIGNAFKDAQLLNIAHQYQQHTDWHRQVASFAQKGA
jgi:aspartyl-tRNA(Asn)/glutamyl-tRNA(Gln) amidotransferase subunit A